MAANAGLAFSSTTWFQFGHGGGPLHEPGPFFGMLLVGISLFTGLFFLGPALLALRLESGGLLLRAPLRSWQSALRLAIAIGYFYFTVRLARAFIEVVSIPVDVMLENSQPLWLTVNQVLTHLLLSASIWFAVRDQRLWKAGIGLLLPFSMVFLGTVCWLNLAAFNGTFVSHRNGLVLAIPIEDRPWFPSFFYVMVPAMGLAWRFGRIAAQPCLQSGSKGPTAGPFGRLLYGAFLSMWLPMVVGVTLASLATQLGLYLKWRPSLPFDFDFSLYQIFEPGKDIHPMIYMAFTGLCPLFATIAAIRECLDGIVLPVVFNSVSKQRRAMILAICSLSVLSLLLSKVKASSKLNYDYYIGDEILDYIWLSFLAISILAACVLTVLGTLRIFRRLGGMLIP